MLIKLGTNLWRWLSPIVVYHDNPYMFLLFERLLMLVYNDFISTVCVPKNRRCTFNSGFRVVNSGFCCHPSYHHTSQMHSYTPFYLTSALLLCTGILAAFESANRAGGVHGRKLELFSLDDGYDGTRARENAERFKEEFDVIALLGSVGTPPAMVRC